METINIKLEDIIPYKNNAKKHDRTQINNVAESIKQFGMVQPIVIDKNNEIVIGHCRYEALKKLGEKEAPCVMADDLTEEQIKKLRNLDNKLNESEWDYDLLKFDIEDLDFSGFEVDWEIPDLDFEEKETEDDDFDIEIPVEPKSKLGDIYQLGNHRLMCGDSTDISTIERLMNGEKVDLYLTDPPYNVNYEGGTKDKLKIQNDNMEDGAFREFLYNAFKVADNVMRDGAVFYIWHADSEGYNFRGACRDVGWQVRQCLIWNKSSLVMGRQDYHWKHEPCLYGWKDGAAHKWESDRKQTTVLDFDKPLRNGEHPTMKPVKLFDYQIRNNTKKGDVVLDTFGGSGTTLIACEQIERKCYMVELDPKYVDVIIERWEQYTGKKAVLLNE